MVIAVIVRRTGFFYGGTIGIDPKDNRIIQENLLQAVNPYDESALNMALDIKQVDPGVRVLAVTPQSDQADALLGQALSLGADEGVVLDMGPADELSPIDQAHRWTRALKQFEWHLLLVGVRTIDSHEDELGVYLGVDMSLPVVSGIKRIEWEPSSNGPIRAIRKLEKGHGEVIACRLPAVMTVELTGEVRYPMLKNIAAPKRITVVHLPHEDDAGCQKKIQAVTLEKLRPPKVRPKKGLVEVDKNLSVNDKLGQLFSGGVTEKRGADDTLNGPPEQVAEKLVAHMQDKGFL